MSQTNIFYAGQQNTTYTESIPFTLSHRIEHHALTEDIVYISVMFAM